MRTPFVYVMTNPVYGSIKVGHSSEKARRMENLGRFGWQIHRMLFVASTEIAHKIEQATLFQIRHRFHAPQHLLAGTIPVGGWTETASASLISAATIWDVVCAEAGLIQLASDQPSRRVANRADQPRALSESDLDKVRQLAAALGGTHRLSARNVRETVGCRNEYALRLRDAVRAEKSEENQ